MCQRKKLRITVFLFFLLYCAVMAYLLFGRTPFWAGGSYWEQLSWNINLVPFRTIGEYIRRMGEEGGFLGLTPSVVNLYGNVLVFLPCGFFLPFLWKRLNTFGWYLLCFSLALIGVELTQLFTLRGILDIDDLILNVLGAVIGFGLWQGVRAVYKKLRHP